MDYIRALALGNVFVLSSANYKFIGAIRPVIISEFISRVGSLPLSFPRSLSSSQETSVQTRATYAKDAGRPRALYISHAPPTAAPIFDRPTKILPVSRNPVAIGGDKILEMTRSRARNDSLRGSGGGWKTSARVARSLERLSSRGRPWERETASANVAIRRRATDVISSHVNYYVAAMHPRDRERAVHACSADMHRRASGASRDIRQCRGPFIVPCRGDRR